MPDPESPWLDRRTNHGTFGAAPRPVLEDSGGLDELGSGTRGLPRPAAAGTARRSRAQPAVSGGPGRLAPPNATTLNTVALARSNPATTSERPDTTHPYATDGSAPSGNRVRPGSPPVRDDRSVDAIRARNAGRRLAVLSLDDSATATILRSRGRPGAHRAAGVQTLVDAAHARAWSTTLDDLDADHVARPGTDGCAPGTGGLCYSGATASHTIRPPYNSHIAGEPPPTGRVRRVRLTGTGTTSYGPGGHPLGSVAIQRPAVRYGRRITPWHSAPARHRACSPGGRGPAPDAMLDPSPHGPCRHRGTTPSWEAARMHDTLRDDQHIEVPLTSAGADSDGLGPASTSDILGALCVDRRPVRRS